MNQPRRIFNLSSAVLLVIASMVGTGVFTTLGFQAAAVPDGAALLLLWALGALIALCGALSYAELAASLPRSGGEYHFLSQLYHPVLGRLAGLVSLTVGFSAPVALAAMAFGRYGSHLVPLPPLMLALGVLGLITAFHLARAEIGQRFLVGTTWLKIGIALGFALLALAAEPVPGSLSPWPTRATWDWVLSAPFGLSLIYVSYAYGGWNAAVYVVDEVQAPEKTVPKALAYGTLAVAALYLLLNLAFLRTIPLPDLQGTLEVGALSARQLFGPLGGQLLSFLLCLLLLSSISALVVTGSRVLQVMGEDLPLLKPFHAANAGGSPARAILLQQGLATGLILTDSFEDVLTFAGFTLSLFASLTVAGVFLLRRREPQGHRPFLLPFYPLPPLIFLGFSLFALGAAFWERPVPVLGVFLMLSLAGFLLRPRRA